MGEPVAFVYPHFREGEPVETEKLFPPLGLAYLKSQLSELSIPSRIHDCTFSEFSRVVEAIECQQPKIVAMYAMITMARNANLLVHELQERLPETLFIVGGPLPTLFPRWFSGQFHIVFRGESDFSFAAFCNEYLSRSLSPENLPAQNLSCYPGIYHEKGRQIIDIPPVHNPQSLLTRLPLPDRSGFDHDRYQSFWMETYGYTQANIIITRGCPYSCDFCSKPVWGQLYRKPPLDRVLAEIHDILSYGYQRLWIADDSFTLDTRYLRQFCNLMISEGVPVTWTCLSRVDRLSRGLINMMRTAGCVKVYLGLESGDNRTLRIMGKRATVEEGRRAVSLFVEGGIQAGGFFMVGYPGETLESIERTLGLTISLPLDEISINVPYPLPGSPLFERVSGIEEGSDWNKANEIRFMYRSTFDEDQLKKRIRETLTQFREREKKQESHFPHPEFG
jgi:anaerobic magnesium-protoporphyrin IX monomethyl ester cyclase